MDLLELILGNFLGFGFALMLYVLSQVYLNKKKRENELIKQKNFLRLIKDEIEFNKGLFDVFSKLDFSKGEEIGRLKTDNKEGCWSRIIDFHHKNALLISQIGSLYQIFYSINSILDFEISNYENQEIFKRYCEIKKNKINDFIKVCKIATEKVLDLIDKEIDK